jgi:precorrin-2 C20-methyltransferase
MQGTFYGIGVGPGDCDLLTLKAVKALAQADIIAVPESTREGGSTAYDIARPHLKEDVEILSLEFPMIRDVAQREHFRRNNARLVAEQLNQGKHVAFLTLGDPMLYSTYLYLLEYLKQDGVEPVSIPGIYSFNAISNMLNLPLVKGDENMAVVCAIDEENWKSYQSFSTLVLMKVSAYAPLLHKLLSESSDWDFCMVTNAGKPTEVVSFNHNDLKDGVHYFSTVILKRRGTPCGRP